MVKFYKCNILFVLSFFFLPAVKAQLFPCDGTFYITRYANAGDSTFFGRVDFIPNDINIYNIGTLTPKTRYNGSVQYAGYIWTQDFASLANPTQSLALRRFDSSLNSTLFTIANSVPAPGSFTYQFNNAGVDKFGTMYLLDNLTPSGTPALGPNLYAIDLSTGVPTLKPGYPKLLSGLDAGNPIIWGDITVDPTDNKVYTWYHPNSASTNLVGLYEITNLSAANPTILKVGAQQMSTIGSMFFNERGQMFGYGSVGVGNVQDRLYAINKVTGILTQYGLPDSTVSGSDGCECVFRLSLDRSVSTTAINIQKCKRDTFSFNFGLRNTTALTLNNIEVYDTLDSRFSYLINPTILQTQLNATMGPSVLVTIGSNGGGTNNVLRITGLNVPPGLNNFITDVLIDATNITSSFVVTEQAYVKNVDAIYGGPVERSNDPTTYNDRDATSFSLNLLGSACLPPIANNFINHPIPQGSALTRIPNLPVSDPDGIVTSYVINTIPPPSEGALFYCNSGDYPCTGAIVPIIAGTTLTPSQMLQMYFDPVGNFFGDSRFQYSAFDNLNLVSNIGVFTMPITKQIPVANNTVANTVLSGGGPVLVNPITWGDADGTIQSVQIHTIPNSTGGTLLAPCPMTFVGAICNAGMQGLNATVLSNYPMGIPLSPSQAQGLNFSPTPGFTGTVNYNFTVTDNIGNISTTANYLIPLSSTPTFDRPPLCNDIRTQHINNSLDKTIIPALTASDLDGAVASYAIKSVPNSAAGKLFVACGPTPTGATCTAGFFEVNSAVLSANSGSIPLTTTQVQSLRFDPDPSFVGSTSFQYNATDNEFATGNLATYTLYIVNEEPKSLNIKTQAAFNSLYAAIVPPSGSDLDGTIIKFNLKTVPPNTQGTFKIPCTVPHTGGVCSGGFEELTNTILLNYPTGIPLTLAQAAGIHFRPATSYSGLIDFSYTAIDNNSNESALGLYRISIQNQSPNSRDTFNTTLHNTDPRTNLSSKLLATDADGTVNSFKIFSIPIAIGGTLFVPCGGAMATPLGATCSGGFAALTPAVMAANPSGIIIDTVQSKLLAFDPGLYFTGIVNFTYSAVDNSGNSSNVSVYSLPVSGVGNLPPISLNVVAPQVLATNANTAIPDLVGNDPDGLITAFNINGLSAAYKGILSVKCGTADDPTPPFTTCTGGYANLTVAALNSNGGLFSLSTSQTKGLRFDPDQNYTGNYNFSYFVDDDSKASSFVSSYSIPVTGTPPTASPIFAPQINLAAGPTAVPPFIASDVDGTIAEYLIDYLPPVTKGTFSVPCPPNLIGASLCSGGYQSLNANMLNTYPDGIPLSNSQMMGLRFDPSGIFEGNAIMNYHVKDNSGLLSNTAAYNIYIKGVNPYSNDVVGPKVQHAAGPTSITPLHGADEDGSINTFYINSLPLANQGVLSIPCPSTPTGATCAGGFANLTAAVLAANPNGIPLTPAQNMGLRFDPSFGYDGDVIFNFSSKDNLDNLSNVATYVLRVGRFAVLPITLTDFTATRQGLDIQTSWKIENELDINRYEIQVSVDGIQFTTAQTVGAQNLNSNKYLNSLQNYTNPIYYVRLKIISKNGEIAFSKTVTVLYQETDRMFQVWPNPVDRRFSITLPKTNNSNYVVQIFDAKGVLVYSKNHNVALNGNTLIVNRVEVSTNPSSGVYLLQIADNQRNLIQTQKLYFR